MRIIIVDDHWAVRDGLRFALADEPDVEVVAAVESGIEALEIMDDTIDAVVLDIQMPGRSGFDVLESLRELWPDTKVVMLSMHDDPLFVRRAIDLGADGYVLKSGGSGELTRALGTVVSGGMHLQGEARTALFGGGPAVGVETPVRLSPREREIVRLIADGLENKQIARRLEISEATVKTHLKSAFERLGVRTRSEAVATALRLQLID